MYRESVVFQLFCPIPLQDHEASNEMNEKRYRRMKPYRTVINSLNILMAGLKNRQAFRQDFRSPGRDINVDIENTKQLSSA
jgi:hypothetical protein